MEGNKYYKRYIKKLINFNPTDITIKRNLKIDDGYGGHKEYIQTISETVAFYERKTRKEIVTNDGISYTGVNVTKILTEFTTNIIKGDKIIVGDMKYKVLYVKPYFDICNQIELEVIE